MIFGRLEERAEQSSPALRQAAAAGRGDGNGGVRSEATSRVENIRASSRNRARRTGKHVPFFLSPTRVSRWCAGSPCLFHEAKVNCRSGGRRPGAPATATEFTPRPRLRYTLKFASPHLEASGRTAPNMSRIAAILPAAGMGTRMGAEKPKQFLELDGTPIVILSLRRIAACPQLQTSLWRRGRMKWRASKR